MRQHEIQMALDAPKELKLHSTGSQSSGRFYRAGEQRHGESRVLALALWQQYGEWIWKFTLDRGSSVKNLCLVKVSNDLKEQMVN